MFNVLVFPDPLWRITEGGSNGSWWLDGQRGALVPAPSTKKPPRVPDNGKRGSGPFNIFCSAASRVRTKKARGTEKCQVLWLPTTHQLYVVPRVRQIFAAFSCLTRGGDLQQHIKWHEPICDVAALPASLLQSRVGGEKESNRPTTLDGSCGHRRFRASSPYSLGKKKGQLKKQNKSQVGRFLSHDIEAGATSFQLLAFFFLQKYNMRAQCSFHQWH